MPLKKAPDSPTGSSEGLDAKRLFNLWGKKQLAEALVKSAAEVEQLRLRNQTPRARDEYFMGRIKELELRNQTMSEALERIAKRPCRIFTEPGESCLNFPVRVACESCLARAALSEPAEPRTKDWDDAGDIPDAAEPEQRLVELRNEDGTWRGFKYEDVPAEPEREG